MTNSAYKRVEDALTGIETFIKKRASKEKQRVKDEELQKLTKLLATLNLYFTPEVTVAQQQERRQEILTTLSSWIRS